MHRARRGRAPRLNPAAERAVRAAAPREPWLPAGFGAWVVCRVLGMVVLLLAAYVVYDAASADRFQVRSVRIHGNVLLSRTEIEQVAGVSGVNIFWVEQQAVASRLRQLPLVQHAEVNAVMPDAIDITILERQPAAFWVSGERGYLVDRSGVILKAVDGETQQARACAGQPCDPRLAPLPTVADLDGQPLTPGDRVDATALATSARLASLLPTVGVEPMSFEWTRDFGLEVPTRDGWRARFDAHGNVEAQVVSLGTIRDRLAREKTAAELIDVRFGGRPYFR